MNMDTYIWIAAPSEVYDMQMKNFNAIDIIALMIVGFVGYMFGLVMILKYGLFLHFLVVIVAVASIWLIVRWHAVALDYVRNAIRPIQPK